MNYKLVIAYDGTSYGGWQIQPNAVTIQEKLEQALKVITNEKVNVIGSGRTDAGVHALAQVANFHCREPLDPWKLRASLNGLIPADIRVLEVSEVEEEFHARYSATGKCYRYHLTLADVQKPFCRLYSWHCRQRLDTALLKEAAHLFVGEHDFTSFANEPNAGSVVKNPVRNLYRLDVVEEEGGLYLEYEGNGFLYKMVRNITGTLYEVAVGKRQLHEIHTLFEECDRRSAGRAAPAHGLFLAWVDYGKQKKHRLT